VLEGEVPGARSCQSCDLYFDPRITVAIVIPCHNYGEYLDDCLKAIEASSVTPAQVIVVDDASDVPVPLLVGYALNIKQIRIEARSQHKACQAGFEHVYSKYVAFVDADDKIDPKYLSLAIRRIETDRNICAAFPYLLSFGDTNGVIQHGTDLAPDVVRLADIEKRNWCTAGTMYRSEVIRQTLALDTERVKGCGTNDWIVIRTIMRAGPWYAVAANCPLHYRVHEGQMSSQRPFFQYPLQANMPKEIVTIVIAFSGRWDIWPKLNRWLEDQTWPHVRLMILNSTHKNLTIKELDLLWWEHSIQIERIDVGAPGLAEIDRRTDFSAGRKVEAAVAGLYNRAVQMAFGEWLFFLEDDVVPQSSDAISKLMYQTYPDVAAVSGVYKHRYEDAAVAFESLQPLKLSNMAGNRLSQVYGSGLGCLLIRRSVLSTIGLAGDSITDQFYDVDLGRRVTTAGWRWLLNRDVVCDHLCKDHHEG
jgi:GT2 family glycosyltransferase